MKKRIVSIMLVLAFALLALPMSVSAAGGTKDEWSAKVGSISAVDGGVFQINAFDSTQETSVSNIAHARLALYNGSVEEGKVSITFDTASLMAGRADGQAGKHNDTGIIFGGKGIKEYAPTDKGNSITPMENTTQHYFLYFSGDSLNLKEVNMGWSNGRGLGGQSLTADEYKTMWEAAKADGKVKLTIEWTKAGALKVWLNDVSIEKFNLADGSVVPFGSDFGIRASMGHHVPTKILAASLPQTGAPSTGDNTAVWVFTAVSAIVVLGAVMFVSKKRSIA